MEAINQTNYQSTVDKLNQASVLYYEGKDSGMSDEEFDAAIEALRKYEEVNSIKNPNSPTQKVNEGSAEDKIEHDAPMLSLRDVFTQDALEGWLVVKPKQYWCVEEKIDGLSIELVYRSGELKRAVTRGNGYRGMDVTAVIKAIPTIPATISYMSDLTVRVEVYMPKQQFELYNVQVGKAANPRNLAVGLTKRKEDTSGAKYLAYWAFNVQKIDCTNAQDMQTLGGFSMNTHHAQLAFLRHLGFTTVPSKLCDSLQVWNEVEAIRLRREDLPYNIDGAVVKADDIGWRKGIGDDGSVPRWAVAYKYPPKEVETEVTSISYQLGKTGKLTPVANLAPVLLDGSTVTRATLHNKKRMEELDIRVGDFVTLFKAGDIIPAIKSARHTASSREFEYPTHCPVCDSKLNGEVCENIGCPQKQEVRIHYWASKSGLDLRGISGATVQALIDAGKLKSAADFYRLKPLDLKLLPRFGNAKVKKTLEAIEASKKATFDQVLAALCIEGLGFSSAYKLVSVYPTWEELLGASLSDFQRILGEVWGQRVYMTLKTNFYQKVISDLREIFPF